MNVLITGASKGIGEALAYECASHGHNVVLVARSGGTLQTLADKLENQYHIRAAVISEDLTSPNAIQRIINKTEALNLDIHCLINNAGIGYQGEFVDMPYDRLQDMMTLNMQALTQLTYVFAKQFQKQNHGKILQVASLAGFQPGPSMAVYYATKAFVLRFSEALAYELKDSGVGISILCPGPTETHFISDSNLEESRLNAGMIGKMSAEKVAKTGYQGMMNHKRVIIPGVINKLLAYSAKITPTFIQLKIINFLHHKNQ